MEKLILKLLDAADKTGSKSIAIPAIGTGQLKFPKDNVAKIIVDYVRTFRRNVNLEEVKLVAFDKDDEMIAAFNNALTKAGNVSASLRKGALPKASKCGENPST